jgi:hypothetical protein
MRLAEGPIGASLMCPVRAYREFRLVEEAASHAGTCDQLDVPLALALHELHIVARFRPVDARAPSARAFDLYVGQGSHSEIGAC